MQLGGKPMKVKLCCDLTKYDARCTENQEGTTIPNKTLSMYCATDCFVAVKFDNGANMDVLWRSLEILEDK